MKILADMPISPGTVRHLQKLGFECHHITEFGMERATDKKVTHRDKGNPNTVK